MRISLLIFFVYYTTNAFSQLETSYWLFGEKVTLDFNGGNPTVQPGSAMLAPEGSASICDKQGNLLFYTNGLTIWNRLHEVMDNGEGLKGNTSSTQSAIIIPYPGRDSIYYVFVVDNHAGDNGITFSLVNINANNGLGRVESKNTLLTNSTTEKLTAVHHCNNKDVWLLVRLWNSNSFYTFRIGNNGLDLDPIISFSPFNLSGQIWGTIGSMKISPDATKMAAAHGWGPNFIEFGDFNRQDGQITNIVKYSVSPNGYTGFETGPYGVEFSPDSRFLYVYSAYGGSKSQIFQFDLTAGSTTDIQQSKQLIAELPYPYAGSLQLAQDQKIYVSNSFDSSLSVINNPNGLGAASGFQFAAIQLDKRSTLGLPNFVQSFVEPNFNNGDFSATGCETGQLQFNIDRTSGISAVKWDFGDPASGVNNSSISLSPVHRYAGTGIYPVTLIVYKSCSIDTIRKNVYSGTINLNLPDRTQGCVGDSILLSVPRLAGANYRWSNGARGSEIRTVKGGMYRVTISAGCQFTDSSFVVFDNKPLVNLGLDRAICTDEEIVLEAFVNSGASYRWNNGATSSSIRVRTTGTYWVEAVDPLTGCRGRDTIVLKDKPFPVLNLGPDTVVCETELITLDSRISNPAVDLLWQDGSTNAFYQVSKAGQYILRASNGCTIKSDTIRISYITCPIGIPNAFTPNGDGRNDRFRVKYGEGVSQYLFRIYNRNGQMVFETREQTLGWDGNFRGRQQPPGTYVWMLTYFNLITGKPVVLRGTVQLLR